MNRSSQAPTGWRGKNAGRDSRAGKPSLTARRFVATGLVVTLGAVLAYVAWSTFTYRKNGLAILAVDGNLSGVGGQVLDHFACPPLRFTTKSWGYLGKLSRTSRSVDCSDPLPLTTAEDLKEKIERIAERFEKRRHPHFACAGPRDLDPRKALSARRQF